MLLPTLKINISNLMRAHIVLASYGKDKPREALAKTVAFVVNEAKRGTPVTSVSRIDTELQVTTTPVLVARGPRKGLPLAKAKNQYSIAEMGLAYKIVLARMHPYSNYNILTDRKYAIPFSPSSFKDKAALLAYVEQVAQRMVASRHSSTGFFKVSWNAILSKLIRMVPANYRGAVSTWAGEGGRNPEWLGAVEMASANNNTTIVIHNLMGTAPEYPTIQAIRNMEAHRILEPQLNRAIAAEFWGKIEVLSKMDLLEVDQRIRLLGFTSV